MAVNEDFTKKSQSGYSRTYSKAVTAPKQVTNPDGSSYWVPGTVEIVSDSSYSPYSWQSGGRSRSNTPGFNSPNRPYILKSRPYTYNKKENLSVGYYETWTVPYSVASGPGSAGYEQMQMFTVNKQSFAPIVDKTSSWESQLIDKATRSLLENLRDSSFNAAQATAERKQTADLFSSTAKKVAGAIGHLKKGNFAKAAGDLGVIPKKRAGRRFNSQYPVDQAKAIGNAWLELQYGWKPLLADVYGATEAIAKANNRGNPNTIYHKATGRSRRSENPTYRKVWAPPSGWTGDEILTASGTLTCRVKTGVTFAKSSPPLADLRSLGITNPALLAWELLPYSFVVDWFLPIGDYLASLDATLGLSFVDGYVTVVREYEIHTDYMMSQQRAGYNFRYKTENSTQKLKYMRRTVLSGFPSAPLPSFKNPVSSSHVASAMALIMQLKR